MLDTGYMNYPLFKVMRPMPETETETGLLTTYSKTGHVSMVHVEQVRNVLGLLLVHTVQALLALLALGLLRAGLLGGVNHTADQDDLVAWVVFQGESEGAVGLDSLLLTALAFFVAQLAAVVALALMTLTALALTEDFLEQFLTLSLLLVVLFLLFVLSVHFLVVFFIVLWLVLTLVLFLA